MWSNTLDIAGNENESTTTKISSHQVFLNIRGEVRFSAR